MNGQISSRAFRRRGQRGLRQMTDLQRAICCAVRFEDVSFGDLAQRHGLSMFEIEAQFEAAFLVRCCPCARALVAGGVAMVSPALTERPPSWIGVDVPAHRVLHPAGNRAFAPSDRPLSDVHLGRKRSSLDLAVERRARESGAIEDVIEAQKTIGANIGHGVILLGFDGSRIRRDGTGDQSLYDAHGDLYDAQAPQHALRKLPRPRDPSGEMTSGIARLPAPAHKGVGRRYPFASPVIADEEQGSW